MRWIKCQNCGKVVQVDGEKVFCPECRAELKSKSTLAERTCRECGKTFIGGPRAWYCPECRAERQIEQSRKCKKNGAVRKLGSIDHCEICGKEYVVESGRQRYCKDCAAEAVKKVDRAQSIEWNQKNRERLAEQKKEKKENRKVCRVCGKVFYSGDPSVTCSDGCASVLKSYNAATADFKRGKRKEEPNLVKMAVKAGIDVSGLFEKPNSRIRDLTGQKFGELIAIGYSGKVKRGSGAIWVCLCSCGKICEKSSNILTQGKATSCGHDKGNIHRARNPNRRNIKDLSGMKIGELTVIRRTDERRNGSVVWECQCSCGKVCYVTSNNLSQGTVKSCGHLKYGKRIFTKWIKITPETIPHKEVLAISMCKGPSYKECLIGWIGESDESETGYICENEGVILYDVTHWMEKPKPPED